MIDGIGAGVPTQAGAAPAARNAVEAAQQFESLLIAQMLRTMREAGGSGGWLGTGEEDSTVASAMGMAEEQLAAALSAQGGLGLAKMVATGLTREDAQPQRTD